jgi:hypothetical protein
MHSPAIKMDTLYFSTLDLVPSPSFLDKISRGYTFCVILHFINKFFRNFSGESYFIPPHSPSWMNMHLNKVWLRQKYKNTFLKPWANADFKKGFQLKGFYKSVFWFQFKKLLSSSFITKDEMKACQLTRTEL